MQRRNDYVQKSLQSTVAPNIMASCHYNESNGRGQYMRSQEELGLTIGKIRRERGLSVARLAAAADLVPTTLYRTEAGTGPDYGTLCKIAGALGVKVGDLVDDGEFPPVEHVKHPGVEALAEDGSLCHRHRIKKSELDRLRMMPSDLLIVQKHTAHLILMALRMDGYTL